MFAVIDEVAGTAAHVACWVFILTHLAAYTQPSPLPLWGVMSGVLVGLPLGVWAGDRTGRLLRRISRLARRRRAGVVD